jgi:hypothetical protein
MLTSTPSGYARLPTFSAVIDSLACGLGIARNKEDALAGLCSFGGRIDVYSGSPHRLGLEDRLLDLLAGSNEALRHLIKARLRFAETALTDARAIPLVTEATEAEGLLRFIEFWVAPWIAQLLVDAHQHPESVLGNARQLLDRHAASGATNYMACWKAAVKRAIPEGIDAREFRSMLDRLDRRSQRKHSSIEQDVANLRVEIQNDFSSPQALDATVDSVRRLYLAGMATIRLCNLAAEIVPEHDLLALVARRLVADPDRIEDSAEKALYWRVLDPGLKRSHEYKRLSVPLSHRDKANFDELRAALSASDRNGMFTPAIDFKEGLWHLCHGDKKTAEQCLQRVVANASSRQLGKTAWYAASYLIALRLIEPGPLKFEALNPLIRVRIENMPQLAEMQLDCIPSPFSDWSPHPKPSFYDSHLMGCVASFNELPFAPGVFEVCNPLQRFDMGIANLITQSRQAGAKLTEVGRKRPAIVGTSVKPYQVLRDHLYYRDKLFGLNPSNLPGLDAYAMLETPDQLRLLRFVDSEQFQLDLQAHGLASWRHPDDKP